jgi:pilus assembly protein Flp/PilA
MRVIIGRFLKDQNGATAVEYSILLGVLSLVIVAGIQGFGNSFANMFVRTSDILNASWR